MYYTLINSYKLAFFIAKWSVFGGFAPSPTGRLPFPRPTGFASPEKFPSYVTVHMISIEAAHHIHDPSDERSLPRVKQKQDIGHFQTTMFHFITLVLLSSCHLSQLQ